MSGALPEGVSMVGDAAPFAFSYMRGNQKGASPARGELGGVFGGFAGFWLGGIFGGDAPRRPYMAMWGWHGGVAPLRPYIPTTHLLQ
jgi:hypothetical protein